jgi:hypothetical protein
MKYTGKMDPECIKLCDAMNKVPGIRTIESCCGHGERPYRIWFKSKNLKSLPLLLYWFDRCHVGYPGWNVSVSTDCAMSPVTFMVEGPIGAYSESDDIAKSLEENLKSKMNSEERLEKAEELLHLLLQYGCGGDSNDKLAEAWDKTVEETEEFLTMD